MRLGLQRYTAPRGGAHRHEAKGAIALDWLPGLLVQAKRLAKLLLWIILLACLVGAGGALFHYLDQPVEHISVESTLERIKQSEIEALILGVAKGGFLSMDLALVRAHLEQHEWIATASIRRVWPDRLRVSIKEEVPIARWREHGFLNQSGLALQTSNNRILSELPYLDGPEGSERQVMSEFRDVSKLLSDKGLKISEFVVDRYQVCRMRLASGQAVVLGRHALRKKIQRFMRVWDALPANERARVKAFDARYDNGVAVSWYPADQAD